MNTIKNRTRRDMIAVAIINVTAPDQPDADSTYFRWRRDGLHEAEALSLALDEPVSVAASLIRDWEKNNYPIETTKAELIAEMAECLRDTLGEWENCIDREPDFMSMRHAVRARRVLARAEKLRLVRNNRTEPQKQ